MIRLRPLLVVLLALGSAPALGAVSLALAPNYDDTRTTAYPNGDKPVAGCSTPATWTEAAIGDGGGEWCDVSGDWEFTGFGTTFRQNALLLYKDAGAADVQFEGTVADDYAGGGTAFANSGIGIGLREAATQAAWLFQVHVENTGANIVKCTYGANGSYTTVDGAAGLTRPLDLGVTYDVSSGDLKAFRGGLEVCTTNRAMSDVLAYAVGQSKSTTETLTATLESPTLGTTIDLYTPTDPPSGSPPVLTSSIPNQSGVQGDAFSLTFSTYFTGATSHSVVGLPGSTGLSESSDGVLSGTPNANDASFDADLCATNGDGTTCDTVQFSFSTPSASGNTFTAPDVADVKSTFNCAATGGANGSSWASIRSGTPSHTTPQPGDTILLTSGSRGAVEFQNCHGTSANPITIAKTSSATRLTITGTGGSNDAFLMRDSTWLTVDGLINWTGHTDGCGSDDTLSETPLTDCGILIDASNQFGIKFRGQAKGHTIRGIEVDGNWPENTTVSGMDTAISPNDKNYCVVPDSDWREDFVMENLYLHHVAKEIIYFGDNVARQADLDQYCGGGTNDSWALQRDIVLRGSFLQYAGWDGVNFKTMPEGTNVIEDTVCADIGGGVAGSGANSVCFALFEAQGVIRRNKIRRTSDPPGGAPGINCGANRAPASYGTLECEVYGNDISDTDGPGIIVTNGANADAPRSADIYYNTFTDTGAQCINVASSVDGGGSIRNNLLSECGSGGATGISNGAGLTSSNNRTCAEGSCGFVDHASNDYRLTAGSASVDAGSGGTCPNEDIDGTARPQGAACDQGAYERP